MKKILLINLGVAIFFFFIIHANSINEYGSVCVGPIPQPNNNEKSLGNPAGGGRTFNYSIQIDNGEIKALPFNKNILINKLAYNIKHLLIIRNDDKIIESFWFNFNKFKSNKLCLWFKPLYESWSLWRQSDSKHLCKCNE